MVVALEVKRIVVLVISAALVIISAVGIWNSLVLGDILGLILNIVVIIGSVGGMIGAWRMDVVHLGWFFWTLALLIVVEVAFVMFHFLHHDDHYTAINYTTYNLVTLAILVLGIICTYDLRRAMGVDSLHSEAPLLGKPASGPTLV